MVIIPARPGVFDVNAVQETIQTCRSARKPYAVVVNGAPAERDGVESRIVTIAREALAKFRAPVWSGEITNRADLPMALSQGEGAANITRKAELRRRYRGCGARSNVRSRRSAERRRHRASCTAGGVTTPLLFRIVFAVTKTRGAPRVFSFGALGNAPSMTAVSKAPTPPSARRTRRPATAIRSPTRCRRPT